MTRSIALVALLAVACSSASDTGVQAAAPTFDPHAVARSSEPGASGGPVEDEAGESESETDAQAPTSATAGPGQRPWVQLPSLPYRSANSHGPEPEMLRAPADWRAEPRGLPRDLVERLAGLDERWEEVEAEGGTKDSRLYTIEYADGVFAHWYLQQYPTFHPGTFTVFLEERQTGRMTVDPVEYTSDWLPYGPPEPWSADLDGDGRRELRLQDLSHNGTVRNVYADSFWKVGEDLSLTRVLSYVSKDDPVMVDGSLCGVERKLVWAAPDELWLDVRLVDVGVVGRRRNLGRVRLERALGTERFTAAEVRILDPEAPGRELVSMTGGRTWGWLADAE